MKCEGQKCRYYIPQSDFKGISTAFYCGFYNTKPNEQQFNCRKDDFTISDIIYVLEKLIEKVHGTPYIGFRHYVNKGKYK